MNCKHEWTVKDHNNGQYTVCCRFCSTKLDVRSYDELCYTKAKHLMAVASAVLLGFLIGFTLATTWYLFVFNP